MRTWLAWGVVAGLIVGAAGLDAQRGGGGGGGRGGTTRPLERTSYEGPEYGFSFPVPSDMDLYTPDQPGRYKALLTERRVVYLINPQYTDQIIVFKYTEGVSEADLKAYQTTLETNPPQARLPGFQKIAVDNIRIGKDGGKTALNYVYRMTQDKMEMQVRQVVFLHNGRGFTVTCEAERKRFDKVNKDTFDKFLSKIVFQ